MTVMPACSRMSTSVGLDSPKWNPNWKQLIPQTNVINTGITSDGDDEADGDDGGAEPDGRRAPASIGVAVSAEQRQTRGREHVRERKRVLSGRHDCRPCSELCNGAKRCAKGHTEFVHTRQYEH